MQGKVNWFNNAKGYGFLTRDDGQGDVFVHWTAIQAKGYKELKEKQAVLFEIELNADTGKHQACNVQVIS